VIRTMPPTRNATAFPSRSALAPALGCLAVLLSLTYSAVAQGQTYSVLHSFAGGSSDGASPYGSVILSGSTLYGMTHEGGSKNLGTIFQIGADGSGFNLLHSFAGHSADGAYPFGSLTLTGSTLYGMTHNGGRYDRGTVFKIGTDGTGNSILHAFRGSIKGVSPHGGLTLSGSTLFGMTPGGGDIPGTIFKIGIDGSGYSILHQFFSPAAGLAPSGSLTLSASTLYGMTSDAGSNYVGAVFKVGTDGKGYAILHSFGLLDGQNPDGSLTLSGLTLYGMTSGGGSNNGGTIFQIGTDGSDFGLLHSFAGGSGDGAGPFGSLTLSGSTLYGMTSAGGSNNAGTIFQLGTDGSGFSILRSFGGGTTDGANPRGDLTLSGSTLYGMTLQGGTYGNGTIFALTIPEPSTFALVAVGTVSLLAYAWRRRTRAA